MDLFDHPFFPLNKRGGSCNEGGWLMVEKLLCNFLTITIYGFASIYNLRKNATFEHTP